MNEARGWDGTLGSVFKRIPVTQQPGDKIVRLRETPLETIAGDIRAAQSEMVDIQACYHQIEIRFVECTERLSAARRLMSERMAELGIKAEPVGEAVVEKIA